MKRAIFGLMGLLVFTIISCKNQQNEVKEETKQSDTQFADVPEWSKEVVWYQIFVETFRNGDPTNDPTKEDIAGAYPEFIPEGWEIAPWTMDWYKEEAWVPELKGKTDNQGYPLTNFAQIQQLRRYGGDLQGVLDKIDYLDSLGVTAIYFNPLNDAPSNHKFDARNWRHIDRNFGPNPRADVETMATETADNPLTWEMTEADKLFIQLVDELHKRGIKVIMDYSWNHVGSTFWAFKDVVKNQEKSEYKNWFWIESFDDPDTEENEFSYKGWFGVKNLIELRENKYVEHKNGSFVFEGNFVSEAAKQHIFNISSKWLDPNGDGNPSDGVDGFRLDVCAEVPMGFWREYREIVKGVNPNAYLVGETWFETYPNTMMDPKPLLKGDIFDGVMNYRWYKAAREFLSGGEYSISPSAFVDSIHRITGNLRQQNNFAMMNVASSHDSPRLLTSLFNKNSKYKYQVTPTEEVDYKIHKPDAEAYRTTRLLLAHQYTYPGAPHIWAGDEMGMWGADMGDTRKPLIWPDYNFEDEKVHPFNRPRPVDKVEFNNDHFNYYQKLIQLREDYPVLKLGDIKFLIVDDENQILAYKRFNDSEQILTILNVGTIDKNVVLPTGFSAAYFDILNGNPIQKNNKGNYSINIPARSASILVKSSSIN